MLFFLPCFSYDRDVIKFSRSNQVRNPEVRVCLSRRQFAHEIKLLRYITKELNAVTGICSSDDEDCLEVVDTTMYYNLDAIDLSLVEVVETTASPGDDIEGSGSGGGFPVGNGVDACSVEPSTPDTPRTDDGVIVDDVRTEDANGQNVSAGGKEASLPSSLSIVALTVIALVWGHLTSS